jgi:hypothetical protein
LTAAEKVPDVRKWLFLGLLDKYSLKTWLALLSDSAVISYYIRREIYYDIVAVSASAKKRNEMK